MKNIDNNSSFSQIAEMKSEQEQQINDLVNQLIDRISKCNPLQLLKYCQGMSLKTMVNVPNEEQSQSLESMATQRAVEYVQSILVAYKGDRKEKEGDPSSLFFEISKIVEQIYEKTFYFYLAIGAENKLQNDLDEDLQKDIIEEQLMYSVRGNRFQVMEEEYYRELLSLHSDEFRKLFNIDTTAVVEGIVKLQHSLTQGVCDVINQLGDQIEAISLDDINQISEPTKSSLMSLFQQVLGFDLNDVCKVTGWPETFVKPLSYEIGEAESFLSEKEYAGWPIIDMPIQKRPFIVIDGKYYCFDYYSFADNFYRAIQKQISRLDPNYNWSAVQKEASENFVTQVFQKLLPGSVAYVNNYYPQNESLKSHYENDLIIQYYDTLIIVEVKAGSFVYTAPLFDYKAHIASYKALIEKPSLQCKRAYDYLHKSSCPVLYDEKGNKKAVLNMDSIADFFMFSVSIDNINATAAKAEKISFLNINDPVICIAIDDLLVYQKYFDSPLQFLHFLQQRRRATLSKNLFMNDELDHLGLYISKNCYTQSESNTESFDQVIPIGFTNDIDNYFDQLYHPELSPDKPKQIMPPFFEKALRYLDSCNQKDKTRISTYLLDLSFKAREEFSRHVETVIARQKASRKQMAITMSSKNVNGIRCTCFINQEGVDSLSLKEQEEYTMSTLLGNDEEKRILLAFDCDENDSVTCVEYKVITKNDIPRHKIVELLAAREHVVKNVIPEEDNRLVKVGRNDRCPCGSGKKYKHCCGRMQ